MMGTFFSSSCSLKWFPNLKELLDKKLHFEHIQYTLKQNSVTLCFHYVGMLFTPATPNDFCFQLARSTAYIYIYILISLDKNVKTLRLKKFLNYIQNHAQLCISGTEQNEIYHFQNGSALCQRLMPNVGSSKTVQFPDSANLFCKGKTASTLFLKGNMEL